MVDNRETLKQLRSPEALDAGFIAKARQVFGGDKRFVPATTPQPGSGYLFEFGPTLQVADYELLNGFLPKQWINEAGDIVTLVDISEVIRIKQSYHPLTGLPLTPASAFYGLDDDTLFQIAYIAQKGGFGDETRESVILSDYHDARREVRMALADLEVDERARTRSIAYLRAAEIVDGLVSQARERQPAPRTEPVTYGGQTFRDLNGLSQYLSMEEVLNMCYTFNIDDECLAGSGKNAKFREMVGYLERRGKGNLWREWFRVNRPNVNLANYGF